MFPIYISKLTTLFTSVYHNVRVSYVRLSYFLSFLDVSVTSFVVKLMVWRNERFSYLILKNNQFSSKNDRFSTGFLPDLIQMVSIMPFCHYVYPKVAFITYFRKITGQNIQI